MSISARSYSPEALRAALDPLLGGAARPATEADAVAGVQPAVVAAPATEEEVAALLAFADREGLKVLIRGGGTQLGLGYPPAGGDILLSTARLNRLVEHTPGDLTVTAEAGLPLAELQAALGRAGQWLALDPALPPATTVGGIVATAVAGPRRLRYGGVRDQIIGVRVARADGTIAKGGGKVVKNVAGFDLPKLFTGSLGTLGVILSATFRLYPLPAASRTVALAAPDPAPLCDLALRISGSTLVASAIDVYGDSTLDGDVHMHVRFEGLEEAVEAQARSLIALAGPLGAGARILSPESEGARWEIAASDPVRAPLPTSEHHLEHRVVLKVSLLPSDVAAWLARLREQAAALQLEATWRAHAGHGIVHTRLRGPEGALLDAVGDLRAAALERRGGLVVTDAEPGFLRQLDPWGPVPALALMRRVKEQFDPRATLNPGRFVGGI